ncbi:MULTISPECIES: XRE family transcriptional regulator [unclassified Duganella]|uniref:helix-turn-helix domain-containing protein n=1 Tax=unclassified Duganella TaxID=2636909 RepID=UPI00088C8C52|nr:MULTISPECIES: XRE family transcriptional regulator [unclassified Duganella]SDH04935.1 transcriptional regulator, XRE family with cupin sensor [Duganella sp. OV458]SDK21199.1 Cupin domain-containing protein [Duganella sp. OV510]
MDINQLIARRVLALRNARGLSLAALAERSGVSRSNISLIERGESSATATVLDKLAGALGVTLASLFEADSAAPSPLSPRETQPVWTDPASGYTRRQLSPAVRSPLQLVEVEFPPGRRVAYEQTHNDAEIYQQLWMLEGEIDVSAGEQRWRLKPGDCLAFREGPNITYENKGKQPARYLVSLVTLPFAL